MLSTTSRFQSIPHSAQAERVTAMVDISSEESLAKLVRAAHEWNVRYIVVGNGSNLLFDDRGYEGVVFLMGQSVDEIKMMNENTIYAEAGCSLIKLCRFALEHNLTGLEFAYGIPGTVGGAIYMNAGAYDGEIKKRYNLCELCKSRRYCTYYRGK